MQYFCGYSGYDDEHLPFDPSTIVYFRKRLIPEILGEINEMMLNTVQSEKYDDDDHKDGGNSGTMIVDATCAPSHIRYPQDASLLKTKHGKIQSGCWTICMIRQMARSLVLTAGRHIRTYFISAAVRRKQQRKFVKQLVHSCDIWHGIFLQSKKRLLRDGLFQRNRLCGFPPFTISTVSRKPCMTITLALPKSELSVSANHFSISLFEGKSWQTGGVWRKA